jgi:hypothetical protein
LSDTSGSAEVPDAERSPQSARLLAEIIHCDSIERQSLQSEGNGPVARRPAGLNLLRKRRGEIRTSRQAPNTALQQFVPMPSLLRARPSMTQVSLVSLWARIIRARPPFYQSSGRLAADVISIAVAFDAGFISASGRVRVRMTRTASRPTELTAATTTTASSPSLIHTL